LISFYLTFAVIYSEVYEFDGETELAASLKYVFNLILSSLKENCHRSSAVAKELRQVVLVVLTNELQVSQYDVWTSLSDESGWSEVSYDRENLKIFRVL